jgi:hypothetical protein
MKLRAILWGAAAALTLTLTGCFNPISPPAASGPAGTVTLTIGGGPRAALPSLDQFEKIVLSFVGQDDAEDLPDADITSGSATVTIPAGSWEVTARAYILYTKDAEPAAISNTQTISWNGSGEVAGETTLALGPPAGATASGTLKYAVTLPADIVLGTGSQLLIEKGGAALDYSGEGFANGILSIAQSIPETGLPVSAGRYVVDIRIVKNDGTVAAYRETAVILPGLTTELGFAPAIGDFLDPAAVAAATGGLNFVATADSGSINDITFSNNPPTLAITAASDAETAFFVLPKSADQAVAVSGADAVNVDSIAVGNEAGGSTASDTLAVFKVSGLDGGAKEFVITVTEPGKTGVEAAVTVTRAIAYTVAADGDDTTTSTVINFTFSTAVSDLSADDILITDDTGNVTRGGLTMSNGGANWSLGITVTNAGTVKVAINKTGIQTVKKDVMVRKAPTGGDLTGKVEFGTTEDSDSDVTVGALSNNGEGAVESMTITAVEKGVVYFTAWKEAAQNIAPSGTNAGKVTVHTSGTVDGEDIDAEDGELAVIAVKTGGLPFEGGSLAFGLVVSETGKAGRTVNVTLNITTTKTGGAVFTVTRPAGQTYANGDDNAVLERVDNTTAVTGFTTYEDAIIWVEDNAAANTEYLVRVEQDDTNMKRYMLAFNNAANVTLRLKGSKTGSDGETWSRILKHNGTSTAYVNKAVMTDGKGLFQIGYYGGKTNTFILDSNITLEGLGKTTSRYSRLIVVEDDTTFVLRPGAALTSYYSTTKSHTSSPILVKHMSGKVRLEGGSITDCTFQSETKRDEGIMSLVGASLISYLTPSEEPPSEPGCFYKAASVVLSRNTTNVVCFGSNLFFDEGRKEYDITTGEWSLPPVE